VLILITMALARFGLCSTPWCELVLTHVTILGFLGAILGLLHWWLPLFWAPVWWVYSPVATFWAGAQTKCLLDRL
jgi:hypothetical protein